MNANPILLQKKYARIVELFASKKKISIDKALGIFYHSEVYQLMRDGISDMHCMSDSYLEKELEMECEKKLEQAEDDDTDPFLMDAIQTVVETGQASTSFIQRRFKVGYARAGRIIDQMEERGIISGFQGSKPREVLMSKERWEELKMASSQEAE